MATKKLDEKLAKKEHAVLWAAFRKQGSEPSLWARENHSVLAAASWCSTLHHAAPTALRTLLIMCKELGVPMATVKEMLVARGETTVASMLRED